MAARRPTNHPITGRSLPRSTTLRRVTDDCFSELPPPFALVGHTPSSAVAGAIIRQERYVRTTDGSPASVGLTSPLRVSKYGRAVRALGIHVAGLRYGVSQGEVPPVNGNARVNLRIVSADGYGVSLLHLPGNDYATLYIHRNDTSIRLDGTDGHAFAYRTPRSQSFGLMLDFYTNEAIVYTLDHLGEVRPVVIVPVPGGILHDELTVPEPALVPRLEVENAAGANLRYTRLDVDVWTD